MFTIIGVVDVSEIKGAAGRQEDRAVLCRGFGELQIVKAGREGIGIARRAFDRRILSTEDRDRAMGVAEVCKRKLIRAEVSVWTVLSPQVCVLVLEVPADTSQHRRQLTVKSILTPTSGHTFTPLLGPTSLRSWWKF